LHHFRIISQNLKRSRGRDHAHLRDGLSIPMLILHVVNQYTKFEVSRGTKNENRSRYVTTPLSCTVCPQ